MKVLHDLRLRSAPVGALTTGAFVRLSFPTKTAMFLAAADRERMVRSLLGPVEHVEDVSPWRTAVHEAGHALVALLEAIDFASVCVGLPTPAGEKALGYVSHEGLEPEFPATRVGMRIAVDVAGAVAEELLFGSVDVGGVEDDLATALARAGGDLALVGQEVARARGLLGRRVDVLLRLARRLLAARKLTRDEAVALVRELDPRVRQKAKYSPTAPRRELADTTAARRRLVVRDGRLARLVAAEGGAR